MELQRFPEWNVCSLPLSSSIPQWKCSWASLYSLLRPPPDSLGSIPALHSSLVILQATKWDFSTLDCVHHLWLSAVLLLYIRTCKTVVWHEWCARYCTSPGTWEPGRSLWAPGGRTPVSLILWSSIHSSYSIRFHFAVLEWLEDFIKPRFADFSPRKNRGFFYICFGAISNKY